MIMAKSCHDLDLFQQYAGSKCESLSSMGDLTWFKHENAPEGVRRPSISAKSEKMNIKSDKEMQNKQEYETFERVRYRAAA